MNNHRHILEPYKGMNTRYHCPSCQHRRKTFSLYIDTETGEHLHPTVGRCNREISCGYHYSPKQYFHENNTPPEKPRPKDHKPQPVTPTTSLIHFDVFGASLKPAGFEVNYFVQFLVKLFGADVAGQLVSRYFIATSKLWGGATVFWQIDARGKVRTGKIMLYNPDTGKRVKEPFNHINWVHKVLKTPEFKLRQCLFGEHLLIETNKPVGIVESEKTAIIASAYLPQLTWVAVGSLANLNAEKCSVLQGRTVTLFPDLNGFEKWSSKARQLSHLATFSVSDLLERKATEAERKQGLDLADYLIKFDYKAFTSQEATAPALQTLMDDMPFERIEPVHYFNEPERPTPPTWKQNVAELEDYFTGITLPTQPIKLNHYSTVSDCSMFFENHLSTVKANDGKPAFIPYLNRLLELRERLENAC